MAPPPSSSLPLSQRLMALAQTLQFAWFTGHVTLLLCSLRYGLSYVTFNAYSRWARFSYRTAFLAAAVTYGIVVYKAFRARTRSGQIPPARHAIALATDENVQYLAMALVWLFSSQYPLAMLPFGVYSVFHVATYTRSVLLPTIQTAPAQPTGASPGAKPAASPLVDTIGKFVKQYYDASMDLVAILEIVLWGRILLSAIIFTKGSWILLAIYTAFLRARYANSSFVKGQFKHVESRGDNLVGSQSCPAQARQVWEVAKNLIRTFGDATDAHRYMGSAPAAAPKKTS